MKRILWILPVFFVMVVLTFFVALPFLVRLNPEPVQKILVRHIEEMTGATLHFQTVDLSYFPSLSLDLREGELTLQKERNLKLQTGHFKIYLSPLLFLIGKTEISRIEIEKGKGAFFIPYTAGDKGLRVENLNLSLGSLREGTPVKVEFEGDLEGVEKSLSGEGTVKVPRKGEEHWGAMAFQGHLTIRGLAIDAFVPAFQKYFKIRPVQGTLKAELDFQKEGMDPWASVRADLAAEQFVYQVGGGENLLSSPEIGLGLTFHLSWNPESEEITLHDGTLASPVSRLSVSGDYSFGTGEIREMRIVASDIVLESIPHYWISLKEVIPFNIGFSGESSLEMVLSGTLDHLSVYASWDLTKSLLTYARYFSKPKDLPLNLSFDYLLKDGNILSGNFSVRLKDVTAKGTLTDFYLSEGEGQINVITNKFDLSGWEVLVPPLQGYQVRGGMKLMANLRGDLQKLHETERMFNLTLDDASVIAPSGLGIERANLSLDYGPVSLEIRGEDFRLGGASFSGEMAAFNLGKQPKVKVKMASGQLEPLRVFAAIRDVARNWLSDKVQEKFENARKVLDAVFLPGESLENFSADFQYENKKWNIEDLSFDAYDGEITLSAEIDFSPEVPRYGMDLDVTHLSLARFGSRWGDDRKIAGGNFFVKARMESGPLSASGKGPALTGKGAFLVTNGEFYTFDLFRAISGIPDFSVLSSQSSGTTVLDDLRSKFVIYEGKIVTDKLVMVSDDLSVEGDGEIAFDGTLNYRLNVYLLPALLERFRDTDFSPALTDAGSLFGPIPVLLAGPLAAPELRPDPSLTSNLFRQLVKKRSKKVLSNFLPEKEFFET